MLEREVQIVNKLGMHARAAAKFVQEAARHDCAIKVSNDNREVNGKSIMGIMMLAAARGSSITLRIDGVEEAAAMDALCALIADRFGEDE